MKVLVCFAVLLAVCSAYNSGRSSSRRSGSLADYEKKRFNACALECTTDFQKAVATRDYDKICREYPKYETCLKSGCGRLGRNYFEDKIEDDPTFDKLERTCRTRRRGSSRRSSTSSRSSSRDRTRYGSPSRGSSYERNF